VFHNFGLGPGICDGDNDYDDANTGGPGSHCDGSGGGADTTEVSTDKGFNDLTIAAPSGSQILTGTQFADVKPPLNPGSTVITGSVAVIAGGDPKLPTPNPPMEVGNVGGNLDAAVEGGTWQQLAAPGCLDAPAAYHDHATGLLYIACQTAGGLQLGTTPMVATASGTPGPTTLSPIDVNGLGGVSLEPVGPAISGLPDGAVAIFAVGTDGNVYGRSLPGSFWSRIAGPSDGCELNRHIAAVLGNNGTMVYVACTKADRSAVQFATKSDSTLSGYSFTTGTVVPPFSGQPGFPYACSLTLGPGAVADGPGAAATASGVILTMRGFNGGIYEQAVVGTGSAPSTPQEYRDVNNVGKCGTNGNADPHPSVSFSPGAASWVGAAVYLTVSPSSILDGGSGTVNITALNSSGQIPHSATSVTLSAPGGSGITFAQMTVALVNGVGSTGINVAGNAPAATVPITGAAGGSIAGARGVADVNVVAHVSASGAPPVSSLAHSFSVVRYPSGLFSAFNRGTDGHVDSASQMPNGVWTPWANLGGAPVDGVAAAINSAGTSSGFYIGGDSRMHSATQLPNGVWTPWADLAGTLTGQPVAFATASGLFTAFARDSLDGEVDSASQNPDGTWTPWARLGGAPAGDIAAMRNSNGTVSGFYIGADSHLHSATQLPNGVWTPWADLGGALKGQPSAFVLPNGTFTAFARGLHGGVRSATQNPDGTWSPWADLRGSPNSDIAALQSDSGTVSAFYISGTHSLFSATQMPNGVWTPWVNLGGNLTQNPTAVSTLSGQFSAFGLNHSTRSANSATQQSNGVWTPWANLGGSF
jgi:hypothetical protein